MGSNESALFCALVEEGLAADQIITNTEAVKPYLTDKWPRSLIASPNVSGKTIVVKPRTREEIQKIIKFANTHLIPVVTRGGGSGVCGALLASAKEPLRMVMSLENLNQVTVIDETHWRARVEAGILGHDLERILATADMTLGHFPASLSISSVGGWLATRSSGQASTRYGKIEQMVEAVEVVLGNGEYLKLDNANGAIGPDLIPLLLGSEGALGVMTAVWLRIKPAIMRRFFGHYSFGNLADSFRATQAIAQSGLAPSIVRLYDGFDARHTLLSADKSVTELTWLKRKLLERDRLMVALSHVAESWYKPHLIIVSESGGNDVESMVVDAEHQAVEEILRLHRAKFLPDDVAEKWFARRYSLNFEKVKHLAQNDCFIDTIDLFVPWGKMAEAHRDISALVSPLALIFAHLSHLTPQGACLYLTFVGRKTKERVETYDQIWRAVLDYCLANQLGISDHHGIGILKREAFNKLRGAEWFRLFQAVKSVCDPNNILNPGQFNE